MTGKDGMNKIKSPTPTQDFLGFVQDFLAF